MDIAVQHQSGVQESETLLSYVADIACDLCKLCPFKPVLQSVNGDHAKLKLFCWHGLETPTSWRKFACDSTVDQILLDVALKSVP